MRKKIVIINQYGITPDQPGATKHYDMAEYFSSKQKFDIEFWMCGYNHQTGKNHKDLKGFKFQSISLINKIKVVRIKSSRYRRSSILRQINHTIFDMLTSLKILFSQNIAVVILSVPPISNFNVWAIKLRNIKLVTDVEDLWPLFLIEMGMKNKAAIAYMNFFSNYLYNKSDAIAPVSSGMLDYVKSCLKSSKRTWVAPLGVNLDEYSKTVKDVELVQDNVWFNDFKILYIGAHGRANNLYPVLDTIKEIRKTNLKAYNGKSISFIFIGDGDDKDNLIKYANDNSIDGVYFENSIPGNMVPKYLIHADVCLTNLKKIESFKLVRPNKLFQYMALGKPIICGIWGESEKIVVRDAKSGIYVDFEDKVKAAKDTIEFVNNEKLLLNCSYNGIKYIEKNGDRKVIFEEYYKNIIKLLNEEGD